MPEKQIGFVELQWTCPNCGTKNPGPQKTCSSCGSPQPKNVKFEQVPQQALIQDQEKLAQAKKGADIHCPYCGTRNPADAAICSQCGGDLKSGEKREAGRVVGAYSTQPQPVKQIICPNCATPNPDNRATCSACGANLHEPQSEQAVPAAPAGTARSGRTMVLVGVVAGLLVVALVVVLISKFSSRQQLAATVEAINWSRAIAIQELRDATYSGWQEDVPVEAVLGDCELREHHTQEQLPSGGEFQEVCGTPYTKDTGSGYGEVVQDCSYVVYQPFCDFTVKEWQVVDQVQANGSQDGPIWPEVQLRAGQQEGQRSETYTVIFDMEGERYTYTTTDPQEFSEFLPGSQWILLLNGFNQIVDIQAK
jgi:hypothetical protein